MAKQLSIITFTGRLGNVIGYERKGSYFLRSMPEVVRQTAATRRAAKRFGTASRKGALIRRSFYNDLDIPCDNSHINRLNKLLISAAGDNKVIRGFRFNQHTGIDRLFAVIPVLSDNGILHFPPQDLAQYKNIVYWDVKVIASRIDFLTGQATGTEIFHLMIDPAKPFTGADVVVDVPGKGTLVVTLQIKGGYKDGPSADSQYMAADVIAVVAPQTSRSVHRVIYPKPVTSQLHTLMRDVYTSAYQLIVQRE